MGQTRQVLGEHLVGCEVIDSSVWSVSIIAIEVAQQVLGVCAVERFAPT